MLSIFFFYGGAALFALRVLLGLTVLAHGWPKVKDLKQTAANFTAMGFRPGAFWGTLIALLEFAGSLALIFGFLVQPVAILFVIEFLATTAWRIGKRHPFIGGWELDLALLAGMLALSFLGGGLYSLDRIFLPVL